MAPKSVVISVSKNLMHCVVLLLVASFVLPSKFSVVTHGQFLKNLLLGIVGAPYLPLMRPVAARHWCHWCMY